MPSFQIDRRVFSNIDYPTILVTLFISLIGVVAIKTATINAEPHLQDIYLKQLLWVGAGFFSMVVVMFIDFREIGRFSYILYIIGIALLVYVEFFGKVIYGAQRWIDLGFFSFQASEFTKIAIIMALAKYFDDNKQEHQLVNFIPPTIMVGIAFIIIAKEPDLGTAVMLLGGYAIVVTLTAINKSTLGNIIKGAVLIIPFSWFFLHDYQKKRIYTLLDPSLDPLGSGYHTMQAKIAIGSGGLWGVGLQGGSQSRLNFLPERHTDFIFAVISESFGMVGATVVLVLLMTLIIRLFLITATSRERYSAILSGGLTGIMACYIIFNLGMEVGLFPVVGIPLPLVSYGGSSILFTYISIGIILSLKIHRYRTID